MKVVVLNSSLWAEREQRLDCSCVNPPHCGIVFYSYIVLCECVIILVCVVSLTTISSLCCVPS